MDLSFSFETIFIIYVIILNTLIIVVTLGLDESEKKWGFASWYLANIFLVIFPIIVVVYFL
tara:strand:+ start:165 stop:347 length:183 start_codon:yes stop_codon:yes gene_type:complete